MNRQNVECDTCCVNVVFHRRKLFGQYCNDEFTFHPFTRIKGRIQHHFFFEWIKMFSQILIHWYHKSKVGESLVKANPIWLQKRNDLFFVGIQLCNLTFDVCSLSAKSKCKPLFGEKIRINNKLQRKWNCISQQQIIPVWKMCNIRE